MIGAIAGDIIGSTHEFDRTNDYNFRLFEAGSYFTDDTVLTVAVADCILHNKDYAATFKEYGKRYPYAGYGGMFSRWLVSKESKPYNSYGNGSAMRVSPAGFAFSTLDEVLKEAERSAAVTHNHPEGIKGAQATATCIFLAKQGESKKEIEKYIEYKFNYSLDIDLDKLRKEYSFDVSCQGSVPQSIACFLQSTDYEDAVRNAVSLGGDSDTMACIAGGIAEAFYDMVPEEIKKTVWKSLPVEFQQIIDLFYMKLKNLK